MIEILNTPKISSFDLWDDFCNEFQLNENDLIITNKFFITGHLVNKFGCHVVFQEEYGTGEPSDTMIDSIFEDIKGFNYHRVIGIGGGTILDIAKLFAINLKSPVSDLFQGKVIPEKRKALILIPTTCGTGSEVTNISIIKLNSLHTKLGLSDKSLFADDAVLIPELLKDLPQYVFATSSIDAFIHSVESFLSPKASGISEIFSEKAITEILQGYIELNKNNDTGVYKKFLSASCYAGIAFGTAGCGAVHALSYPIGANYAVPHGEANYSVFLSVMRKYQELNPNGKIIRLKTLISQILKCHLYNAFNETEKLLNKQLEHKKLNCYGIKKEELYDFSDSVLKNQARLLNNNYTNLSRQDILEIYQSAY